MMTTRIAMACSVVLLAGCSFIDDWPSLTTEPGATQDAGPRDGGNDATACTNACTPGGAECSGADVCVLGADGCFTCAACDGCDPATCGTVCELVAGTTSCVCAAQGTEGDVCVDSAQCEAPLVCPDTHGLCLFECTADSDCTGAFDRCVDGYCHVPTTETDCANAVDDDGDGYADCDDFDCASHPACGGMGGEWERCPDGACAAGLECRANVCLRSCTAAADCGGDFPTCTDFDGDSLGECFPVAGCDVVLDGGCDTTRHTCRLIGTDGGSGEAVTGCVPRSGALPIGSACSMPWECEPRAECITSDGTMYACTAWCYTDDPSTCSTGTCYPVSGPTGQPITYMGRDVGLCGGP